MEGSYNKSGFKNSFFASLLLLVFILILCVFISVFCPAIEEPIAYVNDDSVVPEENQNVALQIAYTANFLTDSNGNSDFISDIDNQYIRDYLNFESVSSEDKGLDFYRNPQTRGAVEWFYIGITGSREVANAILKACDREGIPPSLAFALAYTESRFKSTARNVNKNGSVDRGLFQLNDRSFPQLEEQDFFNIDVSARYGMKHLNFCRRIAKDDLLAVAMYNAGVARVKNNQTPKSTLLYVSNIAKYKARLDSSFERDVVSMFDDSLFLNEKETY